MERSKEALSWSYFFILTSHFCTPVSRSLPLLLSLR